MEPQKRGAIHCQAFVRFSVKSCVFIVHFIFISFVFQLRGQIETAVRMGNFEINFKSFR